MPLRPRRLSVPILTATMSRPYDVVDADQLQRDADECLLTYGTTFHPDIITSTNGIYVETASGHRMMDVCMYELRGANVGY